MRAMKMNTSLRSTLLVLSLMLGFVMSGAASAHSALKASTPADGAELASAPTEIVLEFASDARLAKFAIAKDGTDLAIGFKPIMTAAKEFSIPVEGLSAGAYSVSFSIIGDDGHTVAGHFNFGVGVSVHKAASGH